MERAEYNRHSRARVAETAESAFFAAKRARLSRNYFVQLV